VQDRVDGVAGAVGVSPAEPAPTVQPDDAGGRTVPSSAPSRTPAKTKKPAPVAAAGSGDSRWLPGRSVTTAPGAGIAKPSTRPQGNKASTKPAKAGGAGGGGRPGPPRPTGPAATTTQAPDKAKGQPAVAPGKTKKKTAAVAPGVTTPPARTATTTDNGSGSANGKGKKP
jgi:hypothetical protein